MATSITLRSVKGSALTHAEVDDNFSNLKATADAALPSATAATTYQPLDGDLTSIAGLSGTSGFLKKTAANTWSLDTSTYLDTTTAASTYQTQSGMSSYLTTSSASSTYQTLAGMTSYLLSSTATSTYVALAGSTMTGNLTFSGNSRKIIGDFNNATVANRLSFQTSTTNAETVPYIIPNGTGNTAGIVAANASDPTNSSIIRMSVNGSTDTRINSDINGTGTYLPLTIYAGGSERMRIDNAGQVGIGGIPAAGRVFTVGKNITGETAAYATLANGTVLSDVTGAAHGYSTSIGTAAASFTLSNLIHFRSVQASFGASSTVSNQMGFWADSSMVNATNNYGFYGNIAAGTGRWNFYAAGTADNYFAGNVGIGVSSPAVSLDVGGHASPQIRAISTTNSVDNRLLSLGASSVGIVGTYSNHAFLVYTNSTERMRIDSSGNTSIGTTAVTGKFNVALSGSRTLGTTWDSSSVLFGSPGPFSGNLGISFDTTNGATLESAAPGVATYPIRLAGSQQQFFTSGSERMRIDSSGNVGIGTSSPVNKLQVNGSFGRGAPVTKTGDFTLAATENWIICNGTGSITVTLPAASSWTGRELTIKTVAAQTVVSASSNVVPLAGGSAGTAILAATAGKFATLVSDGTNWVIMAAN